MTLSELDGLAGIAALVNSLIMWPTIRALKKGLARLDTHEQRLEQLESRRPPRANGKRRSRR